MCKYCFIITLYKIVNLNTNLGIRLGKIRDFDYVPPYEPSLRRCVNIPYFPKRLVSVGLVQLYLDRFGYGIREAFKQLDCKTKVFVFVLQTHALSFKGRFGMLPDPWPF